MAILQDNKAVELLTASLTLSTSWADLGTVSPIVNAGDYDLAALWIKLDVNDSTGVQIRALASPTLAFTDSYELPIQDAAAALIGVAPQIFQITNNSDQNIVIPFSISDAVPFVKFQAKATVAGATAGLITSAKVSARTPGQGGR